MRSPETFKNTLHGLIGTLSELYSTNPIPRPSHGMLTVASSAGVPCTAKGLPVYIGFSILRRTLLRCSLLYDFFRYWKPAAGDFMPPAYEKSFWTHSFTVGYKNFLAIYQSTFAQWFTSPFFCTERLLICSLDLSTVLAMQMHNSFDLVKYLYIDITRT